MKRQYPLAAEALLDLIQRQRIKAGAFLPPTKILAQELGFTPVIIQKACQSLVSKRVLDRLGYKLIVRAPENTVSLERPICVIAYQSYFGKLAARLLTERGVSHRIVKASYRQNPHLGPLWAEVLAKKPGGIVLEGPSDEDEARKLAQSAGIPVVVCGSEQGLSGVGGAIDVYRGTEAALTHLYELGHRRIAHLVSFEHRHEELAQCYRLVCYKLNLRCSPSSIWRPKIGSVEGVMETLRLKRQQHPEITALFVTVTVGLMALELFNVPDELSVVAWGELGNAQSRPALTTIELRDRACLAKWACTEIVSQVLAISSGRPWPPSTPAFFAPKLMKRDSTRTLMSGKVPAKRIEMAPLMKPSPSETWQRVYPYLKRYSSTEWLPLDLSKLTNHSMTRHYGWLGAEPLEHFSPGLKSIHGVPFQVLDENRHGGRVVITFRSPHSHSSEGKSLPTRAKISVNSHVKALYFLHGCGWASPCPFAQYRIYYGENDFDSAILFPLGIFGRKSLKQIKGHSPNVQDWWVGNEQVHFPHAHYASVFDPANPSAYERTLYSLEWINPRPKDKVKFIQVRVDPEAGPSLALIAATALL